MIWWVVLGIIMLANVGSAVVCYWSTGINQKSNEELIKFLANRQD